MDEPGLALRTYWRAFLRWWWILILGGAGAAVAALLASLTMTPIYEASTKVLVQGGRSPGALSVSDIQAGQQIAQNYSNLIKMLPVMDRVIQSLELPYGPATLSKKIAVSSPLSLIVITVLDPDPNLAALIANTTAQMFIDDFRERQFTQIAQFQSSLSQYGLTSDPGIVAAQAATMSTLGVVEQAVPPSSPSSPRTRLNVLLATVLGLLVAGLVVLLLEYLDDRVRTPEELKALTGLAILGSVPRYQPSDGPLPTILADKDRHGAIAESYAFLLTSLELLALGAQEMKTLLVTSSSPQEGKTTTAVNLGIAKATGGKSVILVDFDLRRPGLHRVFDLEEHKGLTQLVLGIATLDEALADTGVEGLQVITTGPLPPDPAAFLRSPRTREVLDQLTERADLVIFDSPPLLTMADAMLIATLVDGVIFVVDALQMERGAVRHGVETLRQAKPPFMGMLLNKVTAEVQGSSYYYQSHYYRSYYGTDGQTQGRRPQRRLGFLSRLFRRKE